MMHVRRRTWRRACRDPEFLLRMFVFLLLAVPAIVVAANTSAWWGTALAFTGLAVAVAGVLMPLAKLLQHEDDAEPGTRAE